MAGRLREPLISEFASFGCAVLLCQKPSGVRAVESMSCEFDVDDDDQYADKDIDGEEGADGLDAAVKMMDMMMADMMM